VANATVLSLKFIQLFSIWQRYEFGGM